MCKNTTVSEMIMNQIMMQKKELETGIDVLNKILDDKNKELEDLKNKYDNLYRKYCLLLDKNDEVSSANESLIEKVTIYENGIYHVRDAIEEMDMMLLSNKYDDEEE